MKGHYPMKENEDKIITKERNRAAEIKAYGEKFNCKKEANKAIAEGTSVEEFKTFVLTRMGTAKPVETNPEIGLSRREMEEYSFKDAILAAAEKNWDLAPFEYEASKAAAQKMKRQPNGFFVPYDVLTRDLSVGTDSAGGYMVATDLLGGSFIEMQRNAMIVVGLGATVMTGLQGDISIPKQSGGATAYWVAEAGAPTESQQTLAQVQLAPKTVGAYTDYSRKLLLQSSIDVEWFVRSDLAKVLGLAVDLAAINGSGSSNQPLGVMQTSGIGAVAGGTNGATPDWDDIVALETAVATDNAAVGQLAYLTNSKVRGTLKTVEKASNTAQFIFETPARAEEGFGFMNGYRCGISNQVPSDLTKGSSSGVCSAIIFGNWNDLLIGQWSSIDIIVDPYTYSTSGTVRIVAMQDVDVAVRHAESFSAMKDALTT
jgi:HK97 family phage major capsid protein